MSTPLALITGAPGWLGTRLVESISRGLPDDPRFSAGQPDRRIRCLVRPGTDTTALRALSDRLEIVEGDLARPDSLAPFFKGAEGATVFHAAGIVHPPLFVRDFARVNADGTGALLENALRTGVRRFIHVSSNSAFGVNAAPDQRFDEDSQFAPYQGYGRSKQRAEELVGAAEARGLETVIVRPPWFYGLHQPARQTLFFRMIRDGRAPMIGDGSNRRSMVYVDHLCQALLLCERVDSARGRAYWIADRRPYPMHEILDTVARVLERDFQIRTKSGRLRLPPIAGPVARLADTLLQSVGLYAQKIHVVSELGATIACDVTRAERELGYDPMVTLEEGMRRSIAALLATGVEL